MAPHRHRQNKVKREHTIIEGLLPLLQRAGELDEVTSITPGRISPRARSGATGLFFQYKTDTGLKLIGRSNTAVQEVFVVTDDPERTLEALVGREIVHPPKRPRTNGHSDRHEQSTRGEGSSKAERSNKDDRSSVGERSKKNGRSKERVRSRERELIERESSMVREPSTGIETKQRATSREERANPRTGSHAARRSQPQAEREPDKVEPKLWNELLRLHQELLELDKALAYSLRPADKRGER